MTKALVNPADAPARQHEKLLQFVDVLMCRVEQATDDSGAANAQFRRAVRLEEELRQRTVERERALDLLSASNALLAEATRVAEAARLNLADAIETVPEGFALFDADEALVMCNSRFCSQLADIRDRLQPGMHFADYGAMVSRSSHLHLPEGETPDRWAVRHLRRHEDSHVMFNVRMSGDRWVQVSEHRTGGRGAVILQNLVSNAIRDTDRGSARVEVTQMGADLHIRVIDTGAGIPESERTNIFREFHRLNARASASGGMGLGLAIVERACAMLGHRIELVSELGRGTTFTLTLSVSDRLLNGAEAAPGPALLQEIGILPDLFLVGFQLGEGMNGPDLIRTPRRLCGPVNARIITANRSPAIRDLCTAADVGVLHKPIRSDDLAAFLASIG